MLFQLYYTKKKKLISFNCLRVMLDESLVDVGFVVVVDESRQIGDGLGLYMVIHLFKYVILLLGS